MKHRHLLLAAAGLITVLAATLPSAASAHGRGGFAHGGGFVHGGFAPRHFHGGARVGVVVGVPLVAPWYGPTYAYPYYPPPVYYPPAPVSYVEQQPQVAAAPAAGIWYYCGSTQSYYPYVKQCAEGWQQVPASPAQ